MNRLLIIISLLITSVCYSQTDTTDGWTIGWDNEISIDTAQRNFVPAKEPTKLTVDPVKQSYELQEYPVRMKRLRPQMPIYRIINPKPPKPLRSYVSLGLGNYMSSSLEAGWVNDNTSKSLMGALLDYEGSLNGPVDKRNSGQSDLSLDLFTTQYLKSYTFTGTLGYHRLGYGLYGYDTILTTPERQAISRSYQVFRGAGQLNSADTNAIIQTGAGLDAYYLSGNRGQSELNVTLDGQLDYLIDSYNRFGIKTNNYFSTVSDSSYANDRYLIELSPYYSYFKKESRLRMNLGFKVIIENDTLAGMGGTHVYPDATFDLTLLRPPGLRVYGGITGGIQQNHLLGFAKEVGFLNSRQQIQNSNELLTIQLGAKTTFLKRFTFDAGVSHSSIQNMRLYKDDISMYNSFSAIYDTVTSTKLSFYGELIYNYGDQSMFGLEVKFDNYEMGSISHAYYRPSTQVILTGQHQISDRVNVGLDLFYIDGLWGYGIADDLSLADVSLDPIVDLSLNAEFKLNKRWFAWTNVNNVFNKQYSYYLQYPTKGTNFLIGLNYSL